MAVISCFTFAFFFNQAGVGAVLPSYSVSKVSYSKSKSMLSGKTFLFAKSFENLKVDTDVGAVSIALVDDVKDYSLSVEMPKTGMRAVR